MKLFLLIKSLTYGLAAAGLVPILLSQELPGWAIVMVLVLGAMSWFADRIPETRRRGAIRTINALTLVFFVVQGVRIFLGESPSILALEFAVVLLVNRLWCREDAIHYQQTIILAFANLVGGTLLSEDLRYALSYLVFVFLSPPLVALVQLWNEVEGRLGPARKNRDADRILSSQRIATLRLVGGASLLGIPILILTGFIFIIYPRIGLGIWAKQGQTGLKLSGFSDEVDLNFSGEVVENTSVVIRFRIDGMERQPPFLPLKFRGVVFNLFDGSKWSKSDLLRRPFSVRREGWISLSGSSRPQGAPQMWIYIEPTDPPVLFIPEGSVAIQLEPNEKQGVRSYPPMEGDRFGAIYFLIDRYAGATYHALLAGGRVETSDPDANDLSLPEGMERIHAYMQSVAGQRKTPIDKADALASALSKSFRYSRRIQRQDSGASPIEDFLFNTREGHCELFATAMAVGLRMLGIPSRLVTGFSGAVYNKVGGYYSVQQRHAHAWVEAYLPPAGWVVYDPTPAADRSGAFNPSSWLAQTLDMARVKWQIWVVGFDLQKQVSLAMTIDRAIHELKHDIRSDSKGFSRSRDGRDSGDFTRRALWILAVLVLAALAITGSILFWKHRRRKLRFAGKLNQSAEEAVRIFLELERALARQGLARPSGRTPREHARRISETGAVFGTRMAQVTESYYSIRFGDQWLDTGFQHEIKLLIQQISSSKGKITSH